MMPLGPFTRSIFKDPIFVVSEIGLCEHIKNDLLTHGSVMLKKSDGNRTCSVNHMTLFLKDGRGRQKQNLEIGPS